MDLLLIVGKYTAVSAAIYLLIALGLIFSQSPSTKITPGGLKFDAIKDGMSLPVVKTYQARDGAHLTYYHLQPANPGPLVVVHGSSAFGAAYGDLALALRDMGAEVLLPDLRGHGLNPDRRGDVNYIGQLEDDLQDLVLLHRKPGQKLIMVGHSSGGGLVVRFAGGRHGKSLNAAVLLAPFLKYNAPTTRPDSGGWARPLVQRTIGLVMLNQVGITALNSLTTLQFNIPAEVSRNAPMTAAYSYRLNTSYAPRSKYLSDIAALPKFMLIVGAQDEAFMPDAYAPLMSGVTDQGSYHIVPETGHLAVYSDIKTYRLIADFLVNFT